MEKGNIVQITNESHHWFPALIVVAEVKNWGILGYGLFPPNNADGAFPAYIRLKNDDFGSVLGTVEIEAE